MNDAVFYVAVMMVIASVVGAVLLAFSMNDMGFEPTNNSTQFENCKVYTIDARRAVLNYTDAKLLCEIMD